MKKTFNVLILSIFVFMSCSQDGTSNLVKTEDSFLFLSKKRKAFEKSLIKKYTSDEFSAKANTASKGAKFIAPFYAEGEGFGITWFNFPYIGYSVFESDYGKGDFYRENNDGTISVHVNSNKASVIYREFSLFDPNDEYTLLGYPGHLSVNFTAEHVFEDIFDPETGEYLFTMDYLDIFNSSRGVSIRGNSKVTNEATGEEHMVALTMANTPGGKTLINVTLK
ncbi:hypothetical protein [Seonamhaeicola maritimus]|uniref:hypothetical protein n=1 Tax=Seonamhaeicola maritimus TaxID=2591822 RepID=UPI0024958CF5|nr:hypothetical protein [Seonamhaeicola maritimus]